MSLVDDCVNKLGYIQSVYWSGLSFAFPGDLPDPGIEPGSPVFQADSLPTEPPGNRKRNRVHNKWTALETFPNLPLPLSKNCLPNKFPRSRKKLQVYSFVPGCWLREMLKQGVPRGRPSLVWGPQQTSESLGYDQIVSFFFNILVG